MTAKRLIFAVLLVAGLWLPTAAQVDHTVDSMRVAGAEWSIDTMEGFYLKRYHFGEGALFCSAQHLFVIEIPARSHRRLAFVSDSTLTEVSTLAERPSR